jgi:hypothetical protein
MEFWTDKEYRNKIGSTVIERVINNDGKTTKIYYGVGMIGLQTPMGEMPHRIDVELNVSSVEEAFEKYEDEMNSKFHDAAKAEVEKLQAEFDKKKREEASQIITPDQIPGKPQFGV